VKTTILTDLGPRGVISTTVIPAGTREEYREKGQWYKLTSAEADLIERHRRADTRLLATIEKAEINNHDADPGDCTDHEG
jgi:hypothetical protein